MLSQWTFRSLKLPFVISNKGLNLLNNYLIMFLQRPIVRKMTGAIFAQGLLSVVNFVIGLTIARYADKKEYGLFVILFSIIGILGSYQNALVNTPLTVLLPSKVSSEKESFISGLYFGQWLFLLPLIIIGIIVAAIYSLIEGDYAKLISFLILSFTSSTFILREFVRTVDYSKLRIKSLLLMDIIFTISTALGILILLVSHTVTSNLGIGILGIGYLISAIFGYFNAQDTYKPRLNLIKTSLVETWQFSRWTLIGVTLHELKERGYIYIVTILLGIVEIADMSAARLLVTPIGIFITSCGKILLAKGADILDRKGVSVFTKFVLSIICILISILGFYVFFLWICHDQIFSLLGEKYSKSEGFVLLWEIYYFTFILMYTTSISLQVFKEFKVLANYGIISAALTISICFFLVPYFRGAGAIISLIIGEISFFLLCLHRFVKISASCKSKIEI